MTAIGKVLVARRWIGLLAAGPVLALSVWLVQRPSAAPPADAAVNSAVAKLPLGMNLSAMTDWTREWPFVDAMKHSRPWISQNPGGSGAWDTQQTIKTTPDGWPLLAPGQAATTLMFRDTGGNYPAGEYICTYAGKGELSFGFDAQAKEARPGRIVLRVNRPTDGGILLRIDRSDAKDPVRDVHVWFPGFEKARSPFHPRFVERLRPFHVQRFMEWGKANDRGAVDWKNRTRPDSARQSGPEGVAIEHMIELCNTLKCDAWFCMPHLADDAYVRQFALLVRERLHGEASVYVEWSNEPWNNVFAQARWVQSVAKRRGDEWTAVIADEAAADFRVWRDVFAGQTDRVVRVASGQHYNPWVCASIAQRLEGEFDAISCAAYFYAEPEDVARFDARTTAEQVLRSATANLESKGLPMLAKHKKLVDDWRRRTDRSIRFVAYEAGQHLTAEGREVPYARAYRDAQTHPMMKAAYRRLLAGFREHGGELLVAYNYVGAPGKHGAWGHLQTQDEPDSAAPKFQALLEAAAPRRPVVKGRP